MKTSTRFVAAAVVALLGSPLSAAQAGVQPPLTPGAAQPGQPAVPSGIGLQLDLLRHPGVQKELQLSPEQTKKFQDLSAQQTDILKNFDAKDGMAKLKELVDLTTRTLKETLTAEQSTRLNQLLIQSKGPTAFFDPEVMKEISLTNEQRLEVGRAMSDAMRKRVESFKDFKDVKPEDFVKKMADMNRTMMNDLVRVLTPEQQQKWKALIGKPYEGVLPGPGIGFGPGPVPPPQPPPPGLNPPPPAAELAPAVKRD